MDMTKISAFIKQYGLWIGIALFAYFFLFKKKGRARTRRRVKKIYMRGRTVYRGARSFGSRRRMSMRRR